MSKISSLSFVALDISGKNYLSWILDAEINLEAGNLGEPVLRGPKGIMGMRKRTDHPLVIKKKKKNLGETIKEGNQRSLQDRAKALIFLRHHLHEDLKIEYLTVKDPLILWTELKKRFDHQKTVILPKAHYDWMHLRLQDFKSVSE